MDDFPKEIRDWKDFRIRRSQGTEIELGTILQKKSEREVGFPDSQVPGSRNRVRDHFLKKINELDMISGFSGPRVQKSS